MSNSILTDTRELNIEELEMVSGGSASSFIHEVSRTALLGIVPQALITSVTEVVLDTAKNHK
jgi:hypothetical protein